MNLSIFGLGYVGAVSAACFAEAGHQVIGVDVNSIKVNIINSGRSPVVEPGVDDLIKAAVAAKRLRATSDTADAIANSDLSLVCVGTPSQSNGSLNLDYIRGVCQEIGRALKFKSAHHVVAMRSTMLPGTIAETVIPTLEEASGKRAARDFSVVINPEFLREGTSIKDFNNPPFTLIGADTEKAADALRQLYAHLDAPVYVIGTKEAEMVKYACNCFHALKVTFGNEIGNICKRLGIDSHTVMDVFCKDTKLNLSPYYLKPGFAFGGSCLPKDLRALTYKAREADLETPMLSALLPSNRLQVHHAIDMALASGRKKIGVLGLSFKANTDDMRESPMVTLIEQLIGKGLQLKIYDREVRLSQLVGANKEYLEREIPHISSLLHDDLRQVIEESDFIIVGKNDKEFRVLGDYLNTQKLILDLVRIFDTANPGPNYQGMCW
jgi:GDP-mannose 6-dehydrogenase